MQTPKFDTEVVSINMDGPEGNAFVVLGKVQDAMKKAGATKSDVEEFMEVATSGDYINLIETCYKWVNFDPSLVEWRK